MRLLLVAATALLATASTAGPPPDRKPAGPFAAIDPDTGARADCPPVSRYHAMRRGGPPTARKLDELPTADYYKAAFRSIGGCEAPIIVRYGVGSR